ncbi:MAG: hypothetical protein ACYCVH_03105 [Ignavibacteriaceae bacterium]
MNTGQSLITIAAMLLLSILVLNVNSTILNTGTVMQDSKFGLLATSIASSMIEEISSKSFDEYTATNAADNLNQLTSPSKLGPESGEVYPNFDDIDDYNGYTRVDSTMPSAIFKTTCSVAYVSPSTPNVTSSSATWNKKITVTVTSISMQDTVRMSTIYSYWYFR